MAEDNPQKELLQEMARLFKRFEKGGDLAPVEDRGEWDKLVESKPPEERELVKELFETTCLACALCDLGLRVVKHLQNFSSVRRIPRQNVTP